MQVAVPGLHGVHQLAAILHDDGLVEEHHWIVRGQLVCVAEVFESRGAIIFAARGGAALEVRRRSIDQKTRSNRPVG